MFKRILLVASGLILLSPILYSQLKPAEGKYRGILYREDGKEVVFEMEITGKGELTKVYIINDEERILTKEIEFKNDSLFFNMPVFESWFRTKIQPDGSLKGTWIKGTAGNTQYWNFVALPGKPRFEATHGEAEYNISGRWALTITRSNGTTRQAVAEWKQDGNEVTGTILTPTGDYRYLHGIVTGNQLLMSTFDGAHAYTFTATIENENRISNGFFGAGFGGKETWIAEKNEHAALPENLAPELKEGHSKLDFAFKDLDGKTVSIHDERFKNKVVIIQIMGSWCPNCMDETQFLSDYYNKNRSRGVEVISLAYEYSTDFERSQKSLRRFQQLFNVQYPMLITGVAVSDTLRTEKTLPQITPIRAFPTTIFLGKDGTVKKLHASYYGPGSGYYHDEFVKEFNATVDALLKE